LAEKHKGNAVTADVNYRIANLLDSRGQDYSPMEGDQEHPYKWYRKQAHELCTKTITDYPNSRGASNCQSLIHDIETKSLSVQVERINIPDQNILGEVSYRNLDKLQK